MEGGVWWTFIIQGFGNVGSAAAYYLAQMGAKVVGIIDRAGGVINEDGFSFEEIQNFFLNKKGNSLMADPDQLIPFEEINERIWTLQTEIFAPCAASRLITKDQISQMIDTGLEVISCGANVPFADKEIFFGPIMEYTDGRVSLIPDFVSNCGMARVFAYFMNPDVPITDKAIFGDVSETIRKALLDVHSENDSLVHISSTALEIALKKLV